jgi:hypothetical protein
MRKLMLIAAALSACLPAYAAEPVSRPAELLFKNGFKDCAPAIDRVVKTTHEDGDAYAFISSWRQEAPNSSLGSTLTTEKYVDGRMVMSAGAVRNASGKCDVVVSVTLALIDSTCPQLRESAFKSWKRMDELGDAEAYVDPASASHVVLFNPLGLNGCLMVKQLAAYDVEA